MDPFHELDLKLFSLINQEWASPEMDGIFPRITDLNKSPAFLIFVAAILLIWVVKKKGYGVRWILYVALCVGISDQLCYRVIKPIVHRPRPEQSSIPLIVRGEHHEGDSFPSNHASNSFAAATALSFAFPIGAPFFLIAAGFVGYSRVYVGAHFPSDVLGGAVIGIIIAILLRIFLARLLERPPDKSREVVERPRRPGANRWA
jgi:undecaprenyl-diphosphatase